MTFSNWDGYNASWILGKMGKEILNITGGGGINTGADDSIRPSCWCRSRTGDGLRARDEVWPIAKVEDKRLLLLLLVVDPSSVMNQGWKRVGYQTTVFRKEGIDVRVWVCDPCVTGDRNWHSHHTAAPRHLPKVHDRPKNYKKKKKKTRLHPTTLPSL